MQKSPASLLDEVSGFLNDSVTEVFNTMLELEARPTPPEGLRPCSDGFVAGSVGFAGDLNGVVYLQMTAVLARTLSARLMGLTEAELEGDAMVNDAVGELSNMVVGSVKSRLCDSGHPCVLTIPSILRGQKFNIETVGPSERRLLGFRCGGETFVVELLLKVSE